MAAVDLQDILEDLNYLLGDTSVPTQDIDNQKRFINRKIQHIYDAYPWTWANSATNMTFSGTSKALPSDFDSLIEVREVVSGQSDNDNVYEIGDFGDRDLTDTRFLAWVDGNTVDGFTLNINQSDNPTLKVTYKKTGDVLSSTNDTTRIPRSMPIALGAYMDMLKSEDSYRDTTQEKADYTQAVNDMWGATRRGMPKKRFFTIAESSNRHFGEPR